MRKNISVIIIDPHSDEHDYSGIGFNVWIKNSETKFEKTVLPNSSEILWAINLNRGFDCLFTIGNDIDFTPLSRLPFEFRKRWVHLDEFNPETISNSTIATLERNIVSKDTNNPLFSFFTSTYNTDEESLTNLYLSLCRQTYGNWNWWIIDDSTSNRVNRVISNFNDPRIFMFKNVTDHGNIGFNKHMIASMCNGDFLVEIDHDDEVTSNCLEMILNANSKYPDSTFFYSHAMEEMDGKPIYYGNNFALGYGTYRTFNVNGKDIENIPTTPDINAKTIRHIVGLPNHVRCWKRDFYHRICGHNMNVSILDDMELLIRTILYGKACKIDEVLYIQHEGTSNDNGGRGSTTQGNRFGEILRTGVILKHAYDKKIHDFLIENGYGDPIWKDTYSDFSVEIEGELPSLNYTYK